MRKRIAYLFLLTALCCTTAFAQPFKRLNYFSYNVNEGLLQSQVVDLAEDGNGFIWLTTASGVQRFDGSKFFTIALTNDNKGLPEDKSVHLFRLRNGNLWLLHKKGITEYNCRTNTFKTIYSSESRSEIALAACEDDAGVWCFFSNEGLLYISKKNFSVKDKIPFKTASLFIPDREGTKELVTIAGTKILIRAVSGVIVFDTKTKTSQLWTSKEFAFRALENFSSDSVLVATDKRIEKISVTTGQKGKGYPLPSLHHIIPQPGLRIQKINDHLFIVCCDMELYELDTRQNKYVSQLVNLQQQPFLNIGFIKGIMPDSFHNLWLVTINDGLRKISYNFSGFRYYGTIEKKNNFVKRIFVDKQNSRVFCGTYNNGLLLFDTLQQLIHHFNYFPGAAAPYSVMAIDKKDDTHYFIFLDDGWNVYLLNSKTLSLQKLNVNVDKLHSDLLGYYGSILHVGADTVLQNSRQIFKLQSKAKAIKLSLLDSLPTGSICAYADGEKNFWLGGIGKYFLLPADHSGLKTFSLPGNILCRCFLEDYSGKIWMATEKGLYRLNRNGATEKIYLKKDGLVDDGIYAIRQDAQHNLWFSHNKGITRMTPDGTLLHFDKNDGLQENEFNTGASFQTTDGEIFFGGVNGVSSFYPSSINILNTAPKVLLANIQIKDMPLNQDTAYWSIEKLELPWNCNILSFEFSAIGLRNPSQYNYQYRMAGVDADWVNGGNHPEVKYNLSPGHYVFYYAVANSFDPSPKNFKLLEIIIHPAFWTTWWFVLLCIFVLGALVFAIAFSISRQQYKRKMRVLQMKQEIQLEKERISRELHDDLGTTANMLAYNVSLLDEEDAADDINDIKEKIKEASADMLLSLRETVWTLKQENITAEDVWTRFKNFIAKMQRTYSSIAFVVEEEKIPEVQLSYNKALNAIRILQEGVNNAVRHAACTCIVCKRTGTKEGIQFIVSDNGKGFSNNGHKEMGNGMEHMEQRAKESGLQLSVKSKANEGTIISIVV